MSTTPQARQASFDFPRLHRALVRASKQALSEVRSAHRQEKICAFALYSDEGAMTVCPAIDFVSARAERWRKTLDARADMTFASAEWALESVGAEARFDRICEQLSDHLDAHPRGFKAFREELFRTCVEVLVELRETRVVASDCLLVFAVSDAEPRPRIDAWRFARMNPGQPGQLASYRAWLRSFG